MIRRLTLRTRLMLIGSGGLAIGFALGSAVLLAILATTLRHTADDQARATAAEVVALVDTGRLGQPVPVTGPSLVQIVDAQERVRAASSTADRLVPLLSPEEIASARSGHGLEIDGGRVTIDGPLRVVAMPAGGTADPVTVIVAVPIAQSLQSVHVLRGAFFVGIPLLIGALALFAWRVIGATLRPVEDLRTGAERITLAQRADRLPVPEGGDEIHRLALTLNQMLDRLESSRVRQRAFVADAAHELRSPLANLRVQLEVTQQHGGAVPIEDLLTDVERLTRLADDLLILARADAPSSIVEPVDLQEIASDAVGRYAAARVPVELSSPESLCVDGDRLALDRVIANLVDNAVRYASSSVRVSLASSGGSARLTVSDDGPGIPEADRARVFERFTRLDDARTRDSGGAGLGLAIVRDLVQRHGGTVELLDASPGTRVVVTLPLPSPRSRQDPPRSRQDQGHVRILDQDLCTET